MSQSLRAIAEKLQASTKKVQLIYAFNGSGKTRLSREFKELISPKPTSEVDGDEEYRSKVLYYNAFTEDLFYWDNDLDGDTERKLIIRPNKYTDWTLREQGQESNAIKHFQRFTNRKLTPVFDPLYGEVRFTTKNLIDETVSNIKISKGEESNFIWSVFFSAIEQVVSALSEPESDSAGRFEYLEHVVIDDPVSSLDENHLIQLAVDLAALIKRNTSKLRFIISTHNPLFFNVLSNEFKNRSLDGNWSKDHHVKWLLERTNDDTFELREQKSDSPFSYHLFLMREIEQALISGDVRKYHFGFMRSILEKTSTYLGYQSWEELLPKTMDGKSDPYAQRLVNFGVHSKHAGDEIEPIPPEIKEMLKTIYNAFVTKGLVFKDAAQVESTESPSRT